jgi:hypothetical protein
MKAAALSNNRAVLVVWTPDAPITDCLGFSVHRIEVETGIETPLKAYLPFEGQGGNEWSASTTDKWPIQNFKWKDFSAKRNAKLKYKIIPMVGTPDNLQPKEDLAVTTNEVTLTTEYGDVSACFNMGILSTQALAHKLPKLEDGTPDPQKVLEGIMTPGSDIRKMLAGDLPEFLKRIVNNAKAVGGHVYEALYELSDPEIVDFLLENKDLVSIVLGNAGENDETNADARKRLHEAAASSTRAEGAEPLITDRILDKSFLPHNKSEVGVDKDGVPVEVGSGSANRTPTGLCTQANNAAIIRSRVLGEFYLDYWKQLKADSEADPKQSDAFRAANRKRKKEVTLSDGTRVTVWFSPNTPDRIKAKTKPYVPEDMKDVFDAISAAKEGVYFLAFYPGFPSIVSKIDGMRKSKEYKHLFIRGAVSSPQALPKPFTPGAKKSALLGPDGQPVSSDTASGDSASKIIIPDGVGDGVFNGIVPGLDSGLATQVKLFTERAAPVIISADALKQGIGRWMSELLKLPEAHAIIHDKIVVIDPLGENPVVILGSHNLGFKASYSNDENLLIIRGNQALAVAYLVHIMDVYDHYNFRSFVRSGTSSFTGHLQGTSAWQDRFFTKRYTESKSRRELEYFARAAEVLAKAA